MGGSDVVQSKQHVDGIFCLLPVACTDFELLGFKFNDQYYFDKMMPFGASRSCAT